MLRPPRLALLPLLPVLLLGASLGASCSDDGGDGGASGAGGGSGGSGGSAGSGGAGMAGGGGSSAMRPPIPSPRFESCSALAPVYAGGGCNSVCTSMRCQCDPFPATYIACHPEQGCLTGMDCSVACERDLDDVLGCVDNFQACTSDADCGDGRCLNDGSDSGGDCSSAVNGSRCLEDADCLEGSCVAVSSDGRYTCQNGQSDAACNTTADCGSGLSCILPATSFVGTCSD